MSSCEGHTVHHICLSEAVPHREPPQHSVNEGRSIGVGRGQVAKEARRVRRSHWQHLRSICKEQDLQGTRPTFNTYLSRVCEQGNRASFLVTPLLPAISNNVCTLSSAIHGTHCAAHAAEGGKHEEALPGEEAGDRLRRQCRGRAARHPAPPPQRRARRVTCPHQQAPPRERA